MRTFFPAMCAAFFILVSPASRKAKPACMNMTSTAASTTQTVLAAMTRSAVFTPHLPLNTKRGPGAGAPQASSPEAKVTPSPDEPPPPAPLLVPGDHREDRIEPDQGEALEGSRLTVA